MRHYACGNNAALTADQAQFIDDEYLSKPRTKSDVTVEARVGFRRTLATAAFVLYQHRRWLGASLRRSGLLLTS